MAFGVGEFRRFGVGELEEFRRLALGSQAFGDRNFGVGRSPEYKPSTTGAGLSRHSAPGILGSCDC